MWRMPLVDREDEPFVADERTMLSGWLEWQRRTLLVKCAGLTGAQLAIRGIAPSNLSLLGLIRHLTDVERTWFRRRAAGEDIAPVYWREHSPDAAFEDVDRNAAEDDVERLTAEWAAARAAVASLSLDHVFVREPWGRMSLRWVYQHMIAEYARHNGHADLLRQRVDGITGT